MKDHNSLGLCSFVELIIDNCSCAFDPCYEVLDKKKTLKINIFTNKIGKGNLFSQNFINKHYIGLRLVAASPSANTLLEWVTGNATCHNIV